MRLVADMIRGMEVNKALDMLKFNSKEASRRIEKLLFLLLQIGKIKMKVFELKIAILIVKEVFVDSGRMLKRIQTSSSRKSITELEKDQIM